ncbi:MAG: PIN domain-containing protein [Proteobacteria bacterium]|nr:PIN domain-containing protein [Pseudomonadota bacterium]
MSDRFFLDTNILVYAYDDSEPEKKSRAGDLLVNGLRSENAVVSTQVFGEFFNVATRHIANPYSAAEAEEILRTFSSVEVVEIATATIWRAIDPHKTYQTSYWDSLILSTAEQAGCGTVYSEDFNHNQVYNGITVVNPFV